ncbi:Hypothetical predicted protein [Mytilus galloprovincialis]|uniref:Uncharacterized protein n=1 Tax=Mytilus galloprovincialis TaxID=29158 RepID=A0A8B6FF45_MYTGA|nr:Hypothetical predicted protein [Mytilus galloprovincialis]
MQKVVIDEEVASQIYLWTSIFLSAIEQSACVNSVFYVAGKLSLIMAATKGRGRPKKAAAGGDSAAKAKAPKKSPKKGAKKAVKRAGAKKTAKKAAKGKKK